MIYFQDIKSLLRIKSCLDKCWAAKQDKIINVKLKGSCKHIERSFAFSGSCQASMIKLFGENCLPLLVVIFFVKKTLSQTFGRVQIYPWP